MKNIDEQMEREAYLGILPVTGKEKKYGWYCRATALRHGAIHRVLT